ncbi:MAG: hypothetical protein AMXMBFR64_21610 [Myxococcales bacterium]
MKRAILVGLLVVAACGDDGEGGGVGDSGHGDVLDANVADVGPGDTGTGDAGGDVPDGSADAGAADAGPDDVGDAGDTAGTVDTAAPEGLLAVPETEAWTLPGLSAPAYVLRTEANVPHVYAATREDLGRVVGFVLARDRYFFMEIQRRYSLGTISALLGDAALSSDLNARLTGVSTVADNLTASLEGEMKAYMEAVASGVNAYIDAVKAGKLPGPSELDLAGPFLGAADPTSLMEPFTLRDLMAIPAALLFETNFRTDDVDRAYKLAQLDGAFEGVDSAALREQGFLGDVWGSFRPLYPGNASSPGFGTSGLERVQTARATPGSAERSMLARLAGRRGRLDQRLTHDALGPYGSNAWAVSGAHTETGGALVAGDGHLALTVPSLMYQIGMDTSVLGGGPIHQAGLLLTPFPVLGAGTNGDVAWSMVNPVVDVTDWYREELLLEDGAPVASRFQGEWRPLVRVDESYVIADVPALGSVGRTETWARWETFDGRRLLEIEGTVVPPGDEPDAFVVRLGEDRVIPADVDGDGVISAISFDYGAFDATRWPDALYAMGVSRDVLEFREATRGVVGGGLFMAAGDSLGNVLFSSYQAIPCRGYLPKDAEGFLPGAHPAFLLDGTTFGAFTLPTDPAGHAVEGDSDPYRCVIPFDAMPQALNPPEGFVRTANNQPAPIDDDGDQTNDAWYIGGPWESPRADTIRRRLEEVVAAGGATEEDMASVQGDHTSRMGERFTPPLLAAIAGARALSMLDGPLQEHEARLVALWSANADRFGEVEQRLGAWSFRAESGVETFYHSPSLEDRADAVATMVFNAWLPRFVASVWGDEPCGDLFPYRPDNTRLAAILAFLDGRGPGNPGALASWSEETGESVFFDRVGTPESERADEVMLSSLADALDYLESPQAAPGVGGFGVADMDAWLWGLRHQVRFESLIAQVGDDPALKLIVDLFSITTKNLPLAETLPAGDPRKGLVHFPRPGDNFAVDAAEQGFSLDAFTYDHGPVMRMVVALGDKVTGRNIIPGGQSGLVDSPHFADQARLWLGNETLPLRLHLEDVIEGATGRETFTPGP